MQADRPSRRVARGEVLALEDAGDREVRGLADDLLEREPPQPLGVEAHLGAPHVEHLAELRLVGLGVLPDLVPRERAPGLGPPGGIADHPGEVADDDDHLVPELLEVPELLQHHGVAEVQVGSGGIQAQLDLERCRGAQRALELRA